MFLLSTAILLDALACTTSNDPCPNPLDPETLDRLEFSLGALSGIQELQPGEIVDLSIGTVECCYIFEAIPACVVWSLEPEAAGSIDPQTGELSVHPETENETVIKVTANIEDGKHVLTQDILVYTLEENPHVGYWREIAQLSCENGSEVIPDALIGELLFQANGTFSVTWAPFEVYRDYWGTYTFDHQTSILELVIESGNHIPENVDLNGQLQVDENGRLLLENMWLGGPAYEQLAPTCGHIFE
jgi:hypothetical protein